MTQQELDKVLADHALWLNDITTGKGANLQGTDLRGIDLSGVNLQGANLLRASLQGADLQGADLQGTNLRGVDLQGANLLRASLQGANLREADLQGANLREANLRGADLRGANLQGTTLRGADLWYTRGIYSFNFGRHPAICFKYLNIAYINIGCVSKPLKTWLKEYKQRGKNHDYSKLEIELYGGVLKLVHKNLTK